MPNGYQPPETSGYIAIETGISVPSKGEMVRTSAPLASGVEYVIVSRGTTPISTDGRLHDAQVFQRKTANGLIWHSGPNASGMITGVGLSVNDGAVSRPDWPSPDFELRPSPFIPLRPGYDTNTYAIKVVGQGNRGSFRLLDTPYGDNGATGITISIYAKLTVDIDTDSNNNGVIEDSEDSIEMDAPGRAVKLKTLSDPNPLRGEILVRPLGNGVPISSDSRLTISFDQSKVQLYRGSTAINNGDVVAPGTTLLAEGRVLGERS